MMRPFVGLLSMYVTRCTSLMPATSQSLMHQHRVDSAPDVASMQAPRAVRHLGAPMTQHHTARLPRAVARHVLGRPQGQSACVEARGSRLSGQIILASCLVIDDCMTLLQQEELCLGNR